MYAVFHMQVYCYPGKFYSLSTQVNLVEQKDHLEVALYLRGYEKDGQVSKFQQHFDTTNSTDFLLNYSPLRSEKNKTKPNEDG